MIKKIVQTWKTADLSDAPPLFALSQKSWKDHHESWEYTLFTDDDIDSYVANRLPNFHKNTFTKYEAQIQRVDIFRLVHMYFDGGLYSDLDAEAINPFETTEAAFEGIVLGTLQNRNSSQYIPNAFLYSGSLHGEFWAYCLALAVKRFFNSKGYDGAEFLTGPALLTTAYTEYCDDPNPAALIQEWLGARDALPKSFPLHIELLNPHVIYPIDWTTSTSEELANNLQERLESEHYPATADPKETVCINYWTHSWEIPERGWSHAIRVKLNWAMNKIFR